MELLKGDCLKILKRLEDHSVDSLVTDPPAGIAFMNKSWDSDKGGRENWVRWMAEVMTEVRRVLKPGAHGLVWAIPRTSHWTAWALEEAGFEIRDRVSHLFGTGFPKSHNISKAIDKAAGAERVVLGKNPNWRPAKRHRAMFDKWQDSGKQAEMNITVPSTPEAQKWDGWGTALKPACEDWWLIRKPLGEKTVSKNVLKWGTGGLNLDGCRIGTQKRTNSPGSPTSASRKSRVEQGYRSDYGVGPGSPGGAVQGRFPSHVVFSHTPYCTDDQCDIECAVKRLDCQSGVAYPSGGVSRFFYCAKPSKKERNMGLEGLEVHRYGPGIGGGKDPNAPAVDKNHHPTVKSIALMSYLIRLITPPNGLVLDPFMGSGSTGFAAKKEGFDFIGIEMESDYFEIAKKRMEAAS